MKRFRRSAALIFTIAVLSGCGKQIPAVPATGSFTEVEIKETASPKGDASYASAADETGFQKVRSDYMGLQFSVPKEWDVSFVNARIIRLDIPQSYKDLPGCTVYIDSCMFIAGEEAISPSGLESAFEADRKALFYNIEGDAYCEAYNESPSEIYVPSSAPADADRTSFLIYRDVFAENREGISFKGAALSSLHFNIDWSEYHNLDMSTEAVTIRTLVKDDTLETARSVLTDIASTFAYYESPIPATRLISLGDCQLSLPEDFQSKSENLAFVPEYANSSFAGMYVGFFREDLSLSDFDPFSYAVNIAPRFAGTFLSKGAFSSICAMPQDAPVPVSVNGMNAEFISSGITYIGSENIRDGNFYGPSGTAMMYVYAIKGGEEECQIVFWFPLQQAESAAAVSDLIISRTSFSKR